MESRQSQRALIGRAGYYIRIAVSSGSDNEVYVANSSFHQSLDAGENFHEVRWGGDTHDIWIDPANPDRFVITDDGGMIITTVHGRGFHRVTLPIGQMYHVAVDDQIPYYFYSNMQDDGNMRGPSVPFDSRRRTAGTATWGAANPASRFPIPPIPTSCGRPATATRLPGGTPATRSRIPSARGSTRSTRRPTTSSIAATGRRRSRSIPSITTPCTTAAR